MNDTAHDRSILRWWPLTIMAALWVGLVLRLSHSEVLRLLVSIASLALLTYQRRILRRNCAGLHLTFLTTLLVSVSIPCFWLALNVVRFYTYNAAADRPYSTGGWIYFYVVRAQDIIAWVGVALLTLVCILGILDFARRMRPRKALENRP